MNNYTINKIFKVFDYIFRIVLINLLIIVPSFLLIYIMNIFFKNTLNGVINYIILIPTFLYLYPSICAGFNLIRKYEMKECDTVFKEFFKSLKRFYLKALIESIIIVIAILLFSNSIFYFYSNLYNGVIYILGFILTIAFIIMASVILIHLPLVMIYMDGCRVHQDIKLAAMMAFKDLGITLALVVVVGVIAYLSIAYETVLIIGGISLPIYLIIKMTFKKYYIVYVRTHKKEREE